MARIPPPEGPTEAFEGCGPQVSEPQGEAAGGREGAPRRRPAPLRAAARGGSVTPARGAGRGAAIPHSAFPEGRGGREKAAARAPPPQRGPARTAPARAARWGGKGAAGGALLRMRGGAGGWGGRPKATVWRRVRFKRRRHGRRVLPHPRLHRAPPRRPARGCVPFCGREGSAVGHRGAEGRPPR